MTRSLKIKIIIGIGIFLYPFFSQGKSSAVTYDLNKGRFGDQLITYLRAKWVSYTYDIPLLYKPILFSKELGLDKVDPIFNKQLYQSYKKKIKIKNDKGIAKNANILYVTDIYFKPTEDLFSENNNVNEVHSFSDYMREIIKRPTKLEEFELPEQIISVAVHIRKGSPGDRPGDIFGRKLKFPSDQFFIDQIIALSTMFEDKPLYVYIFTDYKKPKEIVELYEKKINKSNIIFDCREQADQKVDAILADFFAMTKFDCLIRPDSNFSICAQLLGNHAVVLFPKASTAQGLEVGMIRNNRGLKESSTT